MIFSDIQKKKKVGALLIEVLLTITVMTGGLVLIIQSFTASLRASVHMSAYSTATLLANNKMTGLFEEGSVKDGLSETNSFPKPYEEFQYQLRTKNIRKGSELGFYDEVTLAVSWLSGKNERQILLTTFLPNREEQ